MEKMLTKREIKDKIEKIVNDSCEEIPHEGTNVHKISMIEELFEFVQKLIK